MYIALTNQEMEETCDNIMLFHFIFFFVYVFTFYRILLCHGAGMQCSCGKWVTPAFQIHKNRVDESWNLRLSNKKPI